ncbi:hypothetical protein AB4Z55_13970 [Gordonia sp. ABKF26]|uniref:hypothetical protein n=1 Tax=Gordonia sp. ABKF26 TaxID=3238687 RepID=UPI0034E5DBB4
MRGEGIVEQTAPQIVPTGEPEPYRAGPGLDSDDATSGQVGQTIAEVPGTQRSRPPGDTRFAGRQIIRLRPT